MYKFSQTSRKRLDTCHPLIIELCEEVIKEYDFSVICGHRTEIGQQAAFINGKSNARWGESKHNSNPSLAVDLAPYPIDWEDEDRFIELAKLMKAGAAKKGISLKWGGDFQNLKDLGHFEITVKQSFVYNDIPWNMKYRVLETFQVQTNIIPDKPIKTAFSSLSKDGLLTIEKGFCWDGATGYFDRDTIMRASCIHDAFCNWQEMGLLEVKHRKQADKMLRQHCLEDGMSELEAAIVYRAVKRYVELRYSSLQDGSVIA